MSISFLSRSVRYLSNLSNSPQVSSRLIFTSSLLEGKGKTNWKHLSAECEERTRIVLQDQRKLENLYTAPTFNKNIKEIFRFFPLTPDKVERILLDHSELLNYDASRVIEYIQVLVGQYYYTT